MKVEFKKCTNVSYNQSLLIYFFLYFFTPIISIFLWMIHSDNNILTVSIAFGVIISIIGNLFFVEKLRFDAKVIINNNEIKIYKNKQLIIETSINNLTHIIGREKIYIDFIFLDGKSVRLSSKFTSHSLLWKNERKIIYLFEYFIKKRAFNMKKRKFVIQHYRIPDEIILENPGSNNLSSQ